MSSDIVTKEFIQELVNSSNLFPVDFDNAWDWLGYSTKANALRKLKKYFSAGQDFNLINIDEVQDEGGRRVSRKIDKYFLSVECFKELGMLAQTEQGKLVRKYYLECERIVKEIVPAQKDHIRALELEIELRKTEQKLLDTRSYIVRALPEPIQQKILGYSEIKTVEYRDRVILPSGEVEDGVGITFIQKRYGFTSTKAAWAWLESIGCGKDSGKWNLRLAAVERSTLDAALLEDLDRMAQAGSRQQFLGE